jgi:methylthioribose-1-phosphate isomerase
MKIHGQPHRSIEAEHATRSARIIDQTFLPHQVEWRELHTMEDAAEAIQVMRVRGAPLIGATAAFGLYFALRDDASDVALERAYDVLHATRPTAINLRWALDRVKRVVSQLSTEERAEAAWNEAWVGTEQVRNLRFETDDLLHIVSDPMPHPNVPGRRVRVIVTWKREE